MAAVSPQHPYQDMQKYVVVVLMKISRIKPIDKLVANIIGIIFWSNMCMVSTREEIIPNPPFHSSGPLLVILSTSRKLDFGYAREVLLIGT